MAYLPIKLGGTGKSSWTPGSFPRFKADGTGFEELTLAQMITLMGGTPPEPNQSPTVSAGANKTITANNTSVTATASDPDGTIASYTWSKISGPVEPVGVGFNNGSFTPLRTFTVTGTSGDLVINSGDYLPGDQINLTGNFRSITLNNVVGTSDNPIVFRNTANQVTTVGNPTWAGSGNSYAIEAINSRYFIFAGTHWDNFIINGCTNNTDGGGEPYKSAYRNISFGQLTERFELCYMTINNGGTSVVTKTDPISGQSNTWFPNSELGYMWFHDLVIDNSYNEGFYIGHTATYWNISTLQPFYPSPYDAPPNSTTYKQPILINGVKVWNCLVKNCGKDAIQIAAAKNIEVMRNEVTNWANVQQNAVHNGGILIGGRCETSNVHDNVTHDAWGEHYQFYGTGLGHLFTNNLCYNTDASNTSGDMASLAGRVGTSTADNNPAQVTMTGNTFSRCGTAGSLVRVNGFYNYSGKVNGGAAGTTNLQLIMNKNLLIAPKNNTITNPGDAFDSYYVYTENPLDAAYSGTLVSKGTAANANIQYNTVAASNVNTSNFYLPPSISQGFRKTDTLGPQVTVVGSVIVSPNSATTNITGMIAGTYVFRCLVADNIGATASSNIQIIVNI